MKELTCADCKHFRRHYVPIDGERFQAIPCGHCVYPRLKYRAPKTPACVHFEPKAAQKRRKRGTGQEV